MSVQDDIDLNYPSVNTNLIDGSEKPAPNMWNSTRKGILIAMIVAVLIGIIVAARIIIAAPTVKTDSMTGGGDQDCFTWDGVYYCTGDCLEQEGSFDADDDYYCPENAEERPMLVYDFTVNTEAICNDGTAPRLHYRDSREGPNENKWIFRFEGGANCYDEVSCANRGASDSEVSFTTAPTRSIIYQDPFGGILNGDPKGNTLFHDYNAVHTHYCSSDDYLGQSSADENDVGWHFQGYNIMLGTFQEALATLGLENAEKVIITGLSAGAVGTLAASDSIRSWFAENLPDTEVYFVIDSGWFIESFAPWPGLFEDCSLGADSCDLASMAKLSLQTWNPVLPDACLDAFDDEEWKCLFAEHNWPYLENQDSIFVMENSYDYRQALFHGDFTLSNASYFVDLAVYVQENIQALTPNYLVTGCYNHDSLNMNWSYTTTMSETGDTAMQWIHDWTEAGSTTQQADDPSLGGCSQFRCPPNDSCPLTDPAPQFLDNLYSPGPHVD